MGFLYSKLGDETTSKLEYGIAAACVHGIRSTGDGSFQQPYVVMRTSDEHDVFSHLGKEFESQSLAQVEDRHIDVLRAKDGSECWFDITAAFTK